MKRMLFLLIIGTNTLLSFAQNNKVLLVGIDGCRPDALVAADTPNLDALMANGTYSLDALNTGVTYSGPGWASLLTGVWPEKHGVTDNSFDGDDFTSYPHLFQRIEDHDPSIHTVSIVQWHPINDQIASGIADIVINVDDHTDFVSDAAIEYLSNANPDALFLHFDDVDHAGHSYGFSPGVTEYVSAIETVDAGIGEVLDALYARPSYSDEQWVIIVSTDHGGVGTSHGGNTIQEKNIFMIVSGDGIANEELVADSMLTVTPPVINCLEDTTELYFDGNAYGQSSGSELFNFGASQDFTVECRVRTNQSGDVAILTDKDWNSGLNPGWVFSFNVNGGPWKVNVGDGENRVDLEGNEIADNEWHMLSATFDRDGMLTIYEDGIIVNEASMAALGDITASGAIFMGADSNQDYDFNGYIAETRMFNGIVSPATIDDWSCAHFDATHPDFGLLIAQWSMNEGEGNALMNQGANAMVTSLTGTQWQATNDTTVIWETNYSNTPRQVDFMISALEHLCIPVLPEWELDGEILATYCVEDPDGIVDSLDELEVIVTMSKRLLHVQSPSELRLKLFNNLGQQVFTQQISQGDTRIDLQELVKGVYILRASIEGGGEASKKIHLQ